MVQTESVVSYAQNREDLILDAFFLKQKKGSYVDIGAGDPVLFSVTKHFYDRGWRGINIEPNRKLYEELKRQRPEDTNLNIGISDKKGELPFREYEGQGLSTFSDTTMRELSRQDHPLARTHKDYLVPVEPLKEVLKKLASKFPVIDFMKIDVEGYEYEVITGNDWGKYRPRVICIEASHVHKDWPTILKKKHFKWVFNDGLNDYYVDDLREEIEFNYEDALLAREVLPASTYERLTEMEYRNKLLEDDNAILRQQNQEKDEQIVLLNAHIAERARLKTLIKDTILKIDSIITLQLEKKSKVKKRYPDLGNIEEAEVSSMLATIQRADKAFFIARPSLAAGVIATYFRFLHFGYMGIRKLTFKILKSLRRKIRS